MQIDLEKILVHANEKLTDSGVASEQVDAFKSFLKIETERLRIRHRFGLGGAEIMTGRSYMIDLIVCRACQLAASEVGASEDELKDCAVLALGGYGRRELAPYSDVDILFLHAGRRSRGVKGFVEQVLYLLWDMGLAVGSSFRSVSECVAIARDDLHSRNAMAEGRLITGNNHLFRRLVKDLDESVFKNKRATDSFFEAMKSEIEARYEKFGRTVCLQEPNVKESAGGLRDLHAVLWVGHARYGCKSLDDLRAEDHVSGVEYGTARRAYDFVGRVRNEAHFSTGRRADLITLDLQPTLAANLAYSDKRGLLASEQFMRDYYQRASELHQFSRSFLLRAAESRGANRRFSSRVKQVSASFEVRHGKFYLTLKRGSNSPQTMTASFGVNAGKVTFFEVRQGKLHLKDEPSDFQSNPMRLMEVFSVAQAENVDLSDELKQKIRDNLSLVNRSFRASSEAGRAFVEILRNRGKVGTALRMMYETGFLGRFLPEFGRITFLVQHDFYHKYTIDEHTLRAIETLDQLVKAHDPKLARLGKVLAGLDDVAPLYLGIFLHDIGKGYGGGHVARGVRIAEKMCERLALDGESAGRVVFLVRQHLLMSHISQRRDLSEEGLVDSFAGQVGDLTNLNMLLLLTYADTSAVGPGVWNDWKGALLWELYTRARSLMSSERSPRWDYNRRAAIKQQVIEELAAELPPSEIERHFALMPERYFRATEADRIAQDLRLVRGLEAAPLVASWQVAEDKHCADLTICTRDKAGLFAEIAGTLTAHGANILSADLYTREDGIVLDTFKVSQAGSHIPVKADKWPRIEEHFRAAVEGRYDVGAGVRKWLGEFHGNKRRRARPDRKPAVRFDSEASAASTVVEVRAEDQPGLAYKIASTLSSVELDISFARITTEKSHALDIFYVTDSQGQKLSLSDMPAVEQALLDVLI